MIRVKVEGKNIADLWSLACVHAIIKNDKQGNPCVKVAYKKRAESGMFIYLYAYTDDEIEVESQQSEIGRVIEDLPF